MASDRSGGITMRASRRAVLYGIGGGVEYSYTGTYDPYGDASQGYLVLKTSGTLTIKGTVDLCLVGGGGKGYGNNDNDAGGGGGAGGYVTNYTAQKLSGSYSVTIGEGASTQGVAGGQTSIGTTFTADGGTSATGSAGAVGRGAGGKGGTSTAAVAGEAGVYPWGDSTNFASHQISGCGGGGSRYDAGFGPKAGSAGGGGSGGDRGEGVAGGTNKGGGGGGAGAVYNKRYAGGNGGSGVVFVRWGY